MKLSIIFTTLLSLTLGQLGADETYLKVTKIFTPSTSGKGVSEDLSLIVKNFYKAIQEEDMETLNSLLIDSYRVTNFSDVQENTYSKFTEMSKNIKVRSAALHKALPFFDLKVQEILIDGQKVMARGVISGIQKGIFLGVAPTNKPIHLKFLDIFTIQDGKILEIAEIWNELSVMRQLGYFMF